MIAFLAGGDDGDVAARVHDRRVVDERVGVEVEEPDADADADACAARDRDRRGDAELVVLVAGRDLDVARAESITADLPM